MKDKIISAEDPALSKLSFNVGRGKDNHEVLRLCPDGRILWFVDGEEIVVKDKSLLAIALLDVVVGVTSMKYDYSKIDPELYRKYQEFLKTRKESK